MPGLTTKLIAWSDGVRANRVVRTLMPHIVGRTLDVGCWNGDVTRHLPPGSVGIDIVAPPEPAVPVTLFDGKNIPFGDGEFDTVLCCAVLHHADDQDALLSEMGRVGKRVVLLEDDVDDLVHRLSVLWLHRICCPMVGIPFHNAGFRSTTAWRELFGRHGLKEVEYRHYPGVQPGWPLLRHTLFVLEPAKKMEPAGGGSL
jgi:SAM-dependent methyltransferase